MQLMFSLCLGCSGFLMIGFSPIAPIISIVYDCSIILVDIQLLLYVILFIPANFVTLYVIKHWGTRVTLTIGCLLLLACGWVRQLVQVTESFVTFATLGNIIGAFAQVFFTNCTSKIATVWFGDKERALSTALGGLAMPIGCIAGFVVPALIISEDDKVNKAQGMQHFSEYIFI